MIRAMTQADFSAFWPSFEAVIRAQQTYAFDPNMSEREAYELWCVLPAKCFVYEENGEILASYYLKANAMGPGSHVCNCGYMVSETARGKGIARQLCLHSQQQALQLGFSAMQFNSVVSTNEAAIALWKKLGFDVIGTIPNGYQHSEQGLVDCLIMFKALAT
ncbi:MULTISPECIES: GNAT family N-acetyltransferase [unclassified Agarivorans]|uniref:GNAT family N-acetyltransferase n=1 Tax=unclassified Agarivorans TaxID=2636026 RepID=UPI0026E17B52|nr:MULTISPECIES: GNAT family N-acetyltransferase [unclassified Agarivorans]MDO6687060.1 GNAT family N-acetyltransferase [Agarivorans sp. 3_MG-2023]MDO6713528.1 GNAT family N-acetyltransferase [Agarivorans sp. 2_MG-2023]